MRGGARVTISVGAARGSRGGIAGARSSTGSCDIGFLDQTVDTLPSPAARLACNAPVSGNDGGHDCNPRLARGARRDPGRTARGCAWAHRDRLAGSRREPRVRRRQARARAHGPRSRRTSPQRAWTRTGGEAEAPFRRRAPVDRLDLREADVSAILWSNGYRPDSRGSTRRSSTSTGGRCNGAASRMSPVSTSSVSTGCTRAGRPCSSGSATTPGTSSRTSSVARSG